MSVTQVAVKSLMYTFLM